MSFLSHLESFSVAFHAVLSSSATIGSGWKVQFDKVELNIGSGQVMFSFTTYVTNQPI